MLDLENPTLIALASSLAPGLLRIGGSPEDSIVFDADGTCVVNGTQAPNASYFCSQVHPYVYGCLTASRWQALLGFAARTGLKIAYGLNGCWGRTSKDTTMDFSNIKEMLQATVASPHWKAGLSYFEFSNEIVNAQISAAAWGADAAALRQIIVDAFPAGEAPPLVGPDSGDESPDLARVVKDTAPGVLYALTYHEYPQCIGPPGGTAGSWVVLEPECLEGMDRAAAKFAAEARSQPGLRVWSGEGADHGGGGVSGLTDSFRDSFYYAWRLGALPAVGVELAVRQCFTGGEYEMLQHAAEFAPNPDYFVAWLFKNLVGGGATPLPVTTSVPTNVSGVRAFAFRTAAAAGGSIRGATTLLLLNLNTVNTFPLQLLAEAEALSRSEWHLTGEVSAPHGVICCNGAPLVLGAQTRQPPPVKSLSTSAAAGTPVSLAPASIVFVQLLATS